MNKNNKIRKFHQAKWDEQIIFELDSPGERGILFREVEKEIVKKVGDGISDIPKNIVRSKSPNLPEINQLKVLRHYMRLSQETMGVDVAIDPHGTCTMKYSPKVQEHLASRSPNVTEIHPYQPEETIQGLLEIIYKLEEFLMEISGMDAFSLQPSGGAQAVYAGAAIIRQYHEKRNDNKRDEIITTIFSHPCDAAAPATAGYKIITLMPDENGYPSIEALEKAISNRTAGIFITNPEDTGIYNPKIKDFVKLAHKHGALCYYDQANANGLLGIARAKEAGFDICHFNLHKTFSVPHGAMGAAVGAVGCTKKLTEFLPIPRVAFNGKKYYLKEKNNNTVGKIRSYFGNSHSFLKSYAWILSLGSAGLKEIAISAVLNNNYMDKKMREIPGIELWYEKEKRLEQVRYSWNKLYEDTGVTTEDIRRRFVDYGIPHYFPSHHPWLIPQPFTPEPCESYSKSDIDEFVNIIRKISDEAYSNPDIVKNSPHNASIHKVIKSDLTIKKDIYVTWRQYRKNKQLD